MGRLHLILCLFPIAWVGAEPPWKLHTIDAHDPAVGKTGADGVRLADVNGDGLPDVATGWEEGGAIRVCLHPGVAQAARPWPAVTVGRVMDAEDAVFADLDDDGVPDVVTSAEGGVKQVFVHWAPGPGHDLLDPEKWKPEAFPTSAGRRWMFALPMDVNGNGRTDLVVGAKDHGAIVGWLENPESSRDVAAWKLHEICEAAWIMSLRSMDVDGDGHDDIVISDRRGGSRGVHWLENPGPAEVRDKWTRHLIGGADREVMFLDTGDLNGDGIEDIACATLDGEILIFLRESGDDVSWRTSAIPLPFGLRAGKGVAIADINGDGRADLAITAEAQREPDHRIGVAWLEQTPDGSWIEHAISDTRGRKFDRIEMVDLDGDGDLDLMTCEEVRNLGVIWYENPSK